MKNPKDREIERGAKKTVRIVLKPFFPPSSVTKKAIEAAVKAVGSGAKSVDLNQDILPLCLVLNGEVRNQSSAKNRVCLRRKTDGES